MKRWYVYENIFGKVCCSISLYNTDEDFLKETKHILVPGKFFSTTNPEKIPELVKNLKQKINLD